MTSTIDEGEILEHKREPIFLVMVMCSIFWTGLVSYSLFWNTANLERNMEHQALSEAKSVWNKDAAFRRWASSHGGVYVEVTNENQPNPYLSHISERDIQSTDGKDYTLLNPATMLRDMSQRYEELYGTKGKITSTVVINPVNKPDQWETVALQKFTNSAAIKEIYEITSSHGIEYLRYMRPMHMTDGCDKCHGHMGYKDGDIRGGVSVSIPLADYRFNANEAINGMRITHVLVWALGFIGILSFSVFAHCREQDRKKLLDQLKDGALYDSLTGLANRRLFNMRLCKAIERKESDPFYTYAVFFLDLKRFKHLNDSYGHAIGDQVLQTVAERLNGCVRPGDTVARNSSDEFTILVEEVVAPKELSSEEGTTGLIADRMLSEISKSMDIADYQFNIEASIGICIGEKYYKTPDELVCNSDTAMYRAKKMDQSVMLYDPNMHADIKFTTQIEHDIKYAMERGEIEVHYQPIIDPHKGVIDGFEALVRWYHPTLGPISPAVFIPIAENTGTIVAIGDWVLHEACKQIQIWNETYMPDKPFSIAVNLSARQLLLSSIVENVRKVLSLTRLEPTQLHLELTETMLVVDQQKAQSHVNNLRALGVHLHADDFGTGYSSLTYLQNFNFDTVKIDKDFVQDMDGNSAGHKLTKTILLMAKDMDLSVVAEGVETEEQFALLKEMGCPFMQGYYLCAPKPALRIGGLLNQGAHESLQTLRDNN
ncbi:EAL domain-containing protein [Neptuniibacter sp. QD37_11]|uniref:EAL domain-containing protein n=1 Tax=Neptuniibacter sp. QD37_11 TaxID=3398209 RepID=UPI0039F5D8FA